MAHRLSAGVVLLLAAWIAGAGCVMAQGTIQDPTRPPPGVVAEKSSAADGAGDGGDADDASPPSLSSIVIPTGGKPLAVIDGRIVKVGDRVGEAKVVGISESGVKLKGPQGSETLRITPAVEKKMIVNTSPKRQARVEKP